MLARLRGEAAMLVNVSSLSFFCFSLVDRTSELRCAFALGFTYLFLVVGQSVC